MATAFSSALDRLKHEPFETLLASSLDPSEGQSSDSRTRKLPSDLTLALFVQQIAHGNIACAAMRHLAKFDFSDSAWCQARARLPIERIDSVNLRVIEAAMRELNHDDDDDDDDDARDLTPRWLGHRVFIFDGTTDSMPDTPELRSHYGIPPGVKKEIGFPTSHLLVRMDHRTGLILDCIDGLPCHADQVCQLLLSQAPCAGP